MHLTLNSYITKQYNQISTGDWIVLTGKLQRLFLFPFKLPRFILAFALVMLIRALRPFVIIRFGAVDIGRIGGTLRAEYYLSEKNCGWHQGQYLDWFYFVKSTNHINRQWEKMWRRVLLVCPWSNLVWSVEKLNQWFPHHDVHRIPTPGAVAMVAEQTKEEHANYLSNRDPEAHSKYNLTLECVLGSIQPNLSFLDTEKVHGEKMLRKIGVPLGANFICFHNRDSAFLDDVNNDVNWRYHDFRDSTIQNYLNAAEEMTQKGYYAIRLGAKVNEKVNSENSKIIDYACNGMRDDFLDIYLSAKCRFILCSDTGMSFPAEVFKRPLVFVNWCPITKAPVYVSNGLVIFKKFYLKNESRYLSFSEIMTLEFGGTAINENFSELKLDLIENTADEIRAVTIEMEKRLNGTWETSDNDEVLQTRFWALLGLGRVKSPDLRIGAEYLRQNKDLML